MVMPKESIYGLPYFLVLSCLVLSCLVSSCFTIHPEGSGLLVSVKLEGFVPSPSRLGFTHSRLSILRGFLLESVLTR